MRRGVGAERLRFENSGQVDVGEGESGSHRGHFDGGCSADSGGGAGDEAGFALEFGGGHGFFFLFLVLLFFFLLLLLLGMMMMMLMMDDG